MMPNEPLRDIIRRTMENLKFVERNAAPTGPFLAKFLGLAF